MSNGCFGASANKALVLSILAFVLTILSGCSTATVAVNNVVDEGSETIPAVRINGHVHGGAYPIQSATVVLMETQNTGVWTAAQNAYVGTAKSLYVTTSDARGYFTFPDTGWSCDAGQYVYIEVAGGHTTASSNANVVQVAAVGSCSADLGSTSAIDGINVFLSEPSTVAVAYALHSFLSIHNGNLTGVASDGKATLSTTIPLVDITAPAANNAVPANPSVNPTSTATGAVTVPLSSSFNTIGIYTDGTTFSTTGGFDNDGNAYSSSLVGTTLTYAGVPYVLGTANQQNAVRGSGAPVIPLTSGNFNTLNFLAAGSNGPQASQVFTVTYTDGTTTNFTQGISDWYQGATSSYSGEATALTTKYRDTAAGGTDARQFNIYQYAFTLNKAKLVKSLTLPNNTNVIVLAVTATSNLPTCSGTRADTALACTAAGLAHGFQNAYNLVDQVTFSSSQVPSGVSRATLPNNSQAVAPREMLNTLGNILQECVDSAGGTVTPSYSGYTLGTSRCGDLFYYTTPPGTSPTSPTNTLQAAINIATYPTNNVSQLMGLKPRNTFFSPEISNISSPQTFAFTLSIFYNGTSLGETFASPADLALDVQDNLYVLYKGKSTGAISELTSAGSGVFATTLSGVTTPKTVALDTNGYAWVADDTLSTGGVTGLYTSLNATKTATQGSTYKTITVPSGAAAGLAFDASSNMVVVRDSADTNNTAYLYTYSSAYGTSLGYKANFPFQRAVADELGNFYAVGTNGSTSELLSYNYGSCPTNAAPVTSVISSASGSSLAVNNNTGSQANNAFMVSSGQVSSFNSAGGTCAAPANSTPAKNRTSLAGTSPAGAAMDGNLNLFWVDAAGLIYEMASAGGSTDISSATVSTLAPCYFSGSTCASTSTAKYLGMTIDSSGAMWYLSQGGTYGLVQTLGVAAPTWPLLSSENSGVTVQ